MFGSRSVKAFFILFVVLSCVMPMYTDVHAGYDGNPQGRESPQSDVQRDEKTYYLITTDTVEVMNGPYDSTKLFEIPRDYIVEVLETIEMGNRKIRVMNSPIMLTGWVNVNYGTLRPVGGIL